MPEPTNGNKPVSDRPAALDPSQTWDSLGLIIIFLVLNRFGGLRWAIAGASIWGVRSMVARKRRGSPIGKFLPLLLAYLLIRGGLGILFDSENVYFGIGIAGKVAIGLFCLATVVANKPILGRLAPMLFPFDEATQAHPIYHSTMSHLTILAGAYQLLTSIWDVWLLLNSSVEGFVLIRFLVGTVLSIAVFIGGFFYAQRRLDKIPGFEGLFAMLEKLAAP